MPDLDGQQREALRQILDLRETEWAQDPGDMDQRFVANHYANKLEAIWRIARAALTVREEPTKAKVERVAIALAGKLHWLQDDERALELAHCALAAAREDTERPDAREWTLVNNTGREVQEADGPAIEPGDSVRVREIMRDTERPDPFDRCICGHDRGDHEQGSRGWCMRDHRCECEEFVRDTEQEPER